MFAGNSNQFFSTRGPMEQPKWTQRGALLSGVNSNMTHTPSYGILPPTSPSFDWRGNPKSSSDDTNANNCGSNLAAVKVRPNMEDVHHGGSSGAGAGAPGVARQVSVPYPEIPTPRLTTGFQNRAISVNPLNKRTSGTSVQRTPQKDARAEAYKSPHGDIPEIEWADLEVKESLGNGEFGQVFRGTWKGHEVAIKALYRDPSKAHDQAAIIELRKEIDSFRHLDHKRLVRFVGACFQHPHLCFITEYMPNGSLYNFLHVRKVKLPSKHSLNMSMQLSDGVDYLHSRNPIVVHRDLKSLNVVLDLKFNIKLCDFGLTEYIDKNSHKARHNGGSPRYMAPELFDKKMKITEKIDVWAMACILCEMWGGAIPYDGVKDMPTLTSIMTVQKKSPNVPSTIELEAVKELIRNCFDFDQDLRPSARELCKRLRQAKDAFSSATGSTSSLNANR